MRLIDADKIEYTEYMRPLGEGKYEYFNEVSESVIDAMPTVDAVPVVRCKDCVYFGNRNGIYGFCLASQRHYKQSDFCSRAERRQDETD